MRFFLTTRDAADAAIPELSVGSVRSMDEPLNAVRMIGFGEQGIDFDHTMPVMAVDELDVLQRAAVKALHAAPMGGLDRSLLPRAIEALELALRAARDHQRIERLLSGLQDGESVSLLLPGGPFSEEAGRVRVFRRGTGWAIDHPDAPEPLMHSAGVALALTGCGL